MNKRKNECLSAIKSDVSRIYQYLEFVDDASVMKKVLEKDAGYYPLVSPSLKSDKQLAVLALKDLENYERIDESIRYDQEVMNELFKNAAEQNKVTDAFTSVPLDKRLTLSTFYALFKYCSCASVLRAMQSCYITLKDFYEQNKDNDEYEYVLNSVLHEKPEFVLCMEEGIIDNNDILHIFAQHPDVLKDVRSKMYVCKVLKDVDNIITMTRMNSKSIVELLNNDESRPTRDMLVKVCLGNPAVYKEIPEDMKNDMLLQDIYDKYEE